MRFKIENEVANELALYNPSDKNVVVYQSEDVTLQLDVQLSDDTVWLSQQQMATLFNVKENNITYHITILRYFLTKFL